ncbi:hypothetical protein [Algivirga pacifica]|uniref:ABC transporter permease n=1 Tax=Algivirga pacifica TaxID=1162670 RepID=A0ABP9D9N8_9BACT
MKNFLNQLKWQFVLLQRNNIVTISFAVTLIYGLALYFLRDVAYLDKVLISLVLNDPSVIGYFFIALAIYTEVKHQILPAIFVSPLRVHDFLLSKLISISLIGTICSLGLAISVRGLDFDILQYTIGSLGICLMSAALGLIMLTFTTDFLKFAMLSVPVFLTFINVPMLDYLGVFDMGLIKKFFPIQGSLDLLNHSITGVSISYAYAYVSIVVMVAILYWGAYHLFTKKVVQQ